MRKKELKQKVSRLEADLERTTSSQKYYQKQYYNLIDEIEELEDEIEKAYDEGWKNGYDAAWENYNTVTEQVNRSRAWFKLWL